jgi:MurNAc alpha-1-phosphate uridylyltransferase
LNDPIDRPRVAMILAAGRGERMRPLTDATPKPLLAVRGEPLIHHIALALAQAGMERLVVNLAWLGPQIREFLGDGSRYGLPIVYSEEQPRALETAGGIFRALPHLAPGPFAVVNGDIFTGFPFGRLGIGAADDAHLVLVPNPSQHAAGDFGLEHGRTLPDARERFTFSGIGVYRPRLFEGCIDGSFRLRPLLERAMRAQRCSGELYRGPWEDVGTPERLRALNQPWAPAAD